MSKLCMGLHGHRCARFRAAWGLFSLLGMAACGGTLPEEPLAWRESSAGGLGNSGTSERSTVMTNGLATNGLATNGLATNGLATNGLSTNGLSTTQFLDWFNQAPELSSQVLQYVVRCALPEGASLVWTHPQTGTPYRWDGILGLAPGWAQGHPATEAEQQVVTACLAALTNKFGLSIPISIQGETASGTPIPVSQTELSTFIADEACFFGNLFTGEGVFAGNNGFWATVESSARACGLERVNSPGATLCPPIRHIGWCTTHCTREATGTYFSACTYNGKAYQALTTRLRREDIYRCGDSVCQVSERCGTGLTPDSCVDCGPCQ